MLVDAGPGEYGSDMGEEAEIFAADGPYRSGAGEVVSAALGAPRTIDTIFLTHLDSDHVAGLVSGPVPDDFRLAFPNTTVVVTSEAASWVRGIDERETREGAQEAKAVIRRLAEVGLLVEADDGSEIAPGIRVRGAPGHSPGHAIVEVGLDSTPPSDGLVFLADVLHHPSQASHPEWDGVADSEPEVALTTRRAMLEELAASRVRVLASHLPGPGAVRVVKSNEGFRFVPA